MNPRARKFIPSFIPSEGEEVPTAPKAPGTLKANKKPVRLTRWPAIIGFAIVLSVALIILYLFLGDNEPEEVITSATTPYANAGSASEVINRAPPNASITPDATATLPPPNPVAATSPFSPEKKEVDPEMMPHAVEARRAAWASYHQAKQALADEKRQALQAALKGGTAVTGDSGAAQAGNQQMAGMFPGMPGMPQMPGMPGMQGMPPGGQGGGPNGYHGAGSPAQHRRDFYLDDSEGESDYLPYGVTAPISKYELKAGVSKIYARLVTGMNSDSPGMSTAIVTRDVLDAATGTHILIPQGSELIGTYDNAVMYGQSFIPTAWTRVIYPRPGRESLKLGRQPGADMQGRSGFRDITDNHYGQVFTNAILLSLFSAGTQLSQPQATQGENIGAGQIVASSLGLQLGQLGQEFARRGLDIPPTNEIRQGYEFVVPLMKDIAFVAPWKPSSAPGQSQMVLVNDAE